MRSPPLFASDFTNIISIRSLDALMYMSVYHHKVSTKYDMISTPKDLFRDLYTFHSNIISLKTYIV